MLFYNKVKQGAAEVTTPTASSAMQTDSEQTESAAPVLIKGNSPSRLISGTSAFEREVRESNLQHVLSCYLVDQDLHSFVREMLGMVAARREGPRALNSRQWELERSDNDLPLRTVRVCCEFLMDVLMHLRERSAMRASVTAVRCMFEAHPHTAAWFLSHVLTADACSWFVDYLLASTDALSRASFVQLVVQAAQIVAPKNPLALLPFVSMDGNQNMHTLHPGGDVALCVRLVTALMHIIPRVANHVRTGDEVFVLVRDLAASVPCICAALQCMGCVAYLSFYVLPLSDLHWDEMRSAFERISLPSVAAARQQPQQGTRHEYAQLHQSVFEAMAALLGVPQIRKVSLLQDRVVAWDADLVPEAREALSCIFEEVSRDGGMDTHDINRYLDRVGQAKPAPAQVRSILDRFSTTSDGKLSLEGFLQYHADTASYNPKNVWRVSLVAFVCHVYLGGNWASVFRRICTSSVSGMI